MRIGHYGLFILQYMRTCVLAALRRTHKQTNIVIVYLGLLLSFSLGVV